MKTTRGRPKKPPDEVLSERLELRLTAAERKQYEKAAQGAQLSLSEWIMDRLGKATRREV